MSPSENRSAWCNPNNPLYIRYHDTQWGILRLDDAYLFEMLLLEGFQAGLSWECVLNKRENFRQAFDGFRQYLFHFWDGKVIYDCRSTRSPLSDQLSADLSKRGMRFVGSTILHAFLQAIGIINAHEDSCFLCPTRQKSKEETP